MKKMSKKCSTDQRFIRKRNATYKTGTLITYSAGLHQYNAVLKTEQGMGKKQCARF